jgi:hypothetical protein
MPSRPRRPLIHLPPSLSLGGRRSHLQNRCRRPGPGHPGQLVLRLRQVEQEPPRHGQRGETDARPENHLLLFPIRHDYPLVLWPLPELRGQHRQPGRHPAVIQAKFLPKLPGRSN